MKQKQLFMILGVAGILLWAYGIYSSIPLAKHLSFNTLKMILDNMLSIESLVTPVGFAAVIAGAFIDQKYVVAAGGVVSLIMPLYAIIDKGKIDIAPVIMIVVSIAVVALSLAGKKLKLK